jgi:hypothetical protein
MFSEQYLISCTFPSATFNFTFLAMSLPVPNQFSGHICALLDKQLGEKQLGEKPLEEEIDDDLEGERETIPNLTADDLNDLNDKNPGPFASTWRASIASVSKGITDKTDSEYQQ